MRHAEADHLAEVVTLAIRSHSVTDTMKQGGVGTQTHAHPVLVWLSGVAA
jgi:hypothetical protein